MKRLVIVICLLCLASYSFAEKPPAEPVEPATREACAFNSIAWVWDFNDSDHGFIPVICEAEAAPAPWEWGVSTEFPDQNVWATSLAGAYAVNTGEALTSPVFAVDSSTNMVEVSHYYDTENNYDGCNLAIDGVPVDPTTGYDVPALCTSTSFYAFCVDMEPGFTDGPTAGFITTCFDISAYAGEEVALEFTFGSDSSVTYPGWYLASVTVGGNVTAVEDGTWSTIKTLYR